jgi:hypothetical protein
MAIPASQSGRGALEITASTGPRGATEGILMAQGLTVEMLAAGRDYGAGSSCSSFPSKII